MCMADRPPHKHTQLTSGSQQFLASMSTRFDVYRFDLTKLTPPPSKFHRCIQSCYTFPAKGNFDVYRFDLTKLTSTPPPKFHSCIPSHYTFPAKGNFDDDRFGLTKFTPPPLVKISQMHSIMLHLPPPLPPHPHPRPPLPATDAFHHITQMHVSQMHSITLHQYTNIKCHATQHQ